MKIEHSSKYSDWSTPQDFYDLLDSFYRFGADAAAHEGNAKHSLWFGPGSSLAENALGEKWFPFERVFLNPPYGRRISKWISKAMQTAIDGALVVCLLPAYPAREWFHKYIWDTKKCCPQPGRQVGFLCGRLKFGDPRKGYVPDGGATFDSMLVVFLPHLDEKSPESCHLLTFLTTWIERQKSKE